MWFAALSAHVSRPRDAGVDPLPDHAALKFSEGARDVEQQLPAWRGRVDVLLIKVQIAPRCLQMLDGVDQVPHRAAHAVDGPGHDDIELAPTGVLQHAIEPWPLVPALGAA